MSGGYGQNMDQDHVGLCCIPFFFPQTIHTCYLIPYLRINNGEDAQQDLGEVIVSSNMDTICQGNNPQYEKTGEDTPVTIKHILTEYPSLNNRRCQFFGSTNKTMKQLLNNGDLAYGDTLYKFVTNADLLTKF